MAISLLRSPLLLFLISALLAVEDRVSDPWCDRDGAADPGDLRVVMVADLLLQGPRESVVDLYFRDFYAAKFLRKSFEKLKPDMLVVLGDLSAEGSKMTKSEWVGMLKHFQNMLGPFSGLPLHVILGDRDIGKCGEMDLESIHQIASNLPGLNSAGCGSFEISNISFVSLNAVPMLCEKNKVRFHVEAAIERERLEHRDHEKIKTAYSKSIYEQTSLNGFTGRENQSSTNDGPILLLHLPLYHKKRPDRGQANIIDRDNLPGQCKACVGFFRRLIWKDVSEPYGSIYTLPLNVTEYIFQALRPRIIFSAHTHHFVDRSHADGTREVTAPALTWAARDDPGFVVATFRQNKCGSSLCLLVVQRSFTANDVLLLEAANN